MGQGTFDFDLQLHIRFHDIVLTDLCIYLHSNLQTTMTTMTMMMTANPQKLNRKRLVLNKVGFSLRKLCASNFTWISKYACCSVNISKIALAARHGRLSLTIAKIRLRSPPRALLANFQRPQPRKR
jgi:hypothetical protein